MKVRFLLDENISPRVRAAIQRRHPHIDVLRVGDKGSPPLETLDPEILQYLEQSQRLLITKNRASMPGHVINHHAEGGTHWGIFRVRPNTTIRQLLQTIDLVFDASEAEEWLNEMLWIPAWFKNIRTIFTNSSGACHSERSLRSEESFRLPE